MSLLNYSAPYMATPLPPTTSYFHPQPLPPLQPPHQGPYSYPPPQKPFLNEDYASRNHKGYQPGPVNPYQNPPDGNVLPGYTKIEDDGTKTSLHTVIDYDYDDDDEDGQQPPVTPIQGPIYVKNGSVPVVPLYSHPVLRNGSFVQIPVSFIILGLDKIRTRQRRNMPRQTRV